MERPCLRPLEAYPVEQKGVKFLALRDPSGLTEQIATLPPAAVAVIQLCDGESTRDEICAEFLKRYHQKLSREALDGLLEQLDQALLLDSEHFRQHSAKVFADFARLEVRPAFHAGRTYPKEPARLAQVIDAAFEPPNGPGKPRPGTAPLAHAIVVPHIDFQRGAAAYAWAYRALTDATELPEVIVILGSDHGGENHVFNLTPKHFETPFGTVKTDIDLVQELVTRTAQKRGGGAALLADEHHHRGEHSIEFQMVWLRHLLGDKLDGIRVLPILAGAMRRYIDEDRDPGKAEEVANFLGALGATLEGKRVLWIASADLAHVGPRYGQLEPLTAGDRESLEKRDQVTLEHVTRADPQAWFKSIKNERDRRNVCGLAPIYAMLAAARPGPGRLAVYAQCPAEPDSIVSIAALVYPGRAARTTAATAPATDGATAAGPTRQAAPAPDTTDSAAPAAPAGAAPGPDPETKENNG